MNNTKQKIAEQISREEDFESGSLIGIRNPPIQAQFGKLNPNESAKLIIEQHNPGVRYLVIYDGTPIAWVSKAGQVYKVGQKISYRPQGMLYLLH